ncbi:MAG: AAA family ATPase [Oscillibacter sp.]|nr:AAA family ATPase [Oscillibacter sp.]
MNQNYIRGIRLKSEPPRESYISQLPVVRSLLRQGELPFEKPVTFLVGENGVGKSTLLEAVAVAYGFNAEGGTRNFNFATVHTESLLHTYLTLIRGSYPRDGFFLRAESFYNVASNIDEMDKGASFGGRVIDSYGGVSLHRQSHGESFLSLVQNRFGGRGLYLLDEPEAALSPTRLMTLLCEIHRLVEANSQFIIATHSPILMAYPGAALYELTDTGIRAVAYRETEHYQLTRRFLENPEQMLHYLLSGEA